MSGAGLPAQDFSSAGRTRTDDVRSHFHYHLCVLDGVFERTEDQTHQGRHIRLGSPGFGIQRVQLYRYR